VNRNDPKWSKASESQYSLMEFRREYLDDAKLRMDPTYWDKSMPNHKTTVARAQELCRHLRRSPRRRWARPRSNSPLYSVKG